MTDISKERLKQLADDAMSDGLEDYGMALDAASARLQELEAFISKQYPGFNIDEALVLFNVPQKTVAMQGAPDDVADLDSRMKEAGMIPLSELLEGHGSLEKWLRHADVHSFEDFVTWVKSKQREFMAMRMRYELGDKSKDDDLFEWVFAHAAAFDGVATQLRAITPPADAIAEAVKDAERYRWLRSRDLEEIQEGGVFAGVTPDNLVINGEDLDKHVDAAIQAKRVL